VELLCVLVGGGLVWWSIRASSGKSTEKEEARLNDAARRRREVDEAPDRALRAFSLYEDARTEVGRFDAGHISFSSSRLASKPPDIVTGLTFEKDRLYVLRGQGMIIFPFTSALTVAVLNTRPAGFQEQTDFAMALSYDGKDAAVRFPLSFPGWLEVIDEARRGGATIEMDEELPESLQELIAHPLPGDEHYEAVRIRPPAEPARGLRARCPSCGANLGGRQTCDFCGGR
jgi:hypothetical protein